MSVMEVNCRVMHYTCFGAYGDTVGFYAFGFCHACWFFVFIMQHFCILLWVNLSLLRVILVGSCSRMRRSKKVIMVDGDIVYEKYIFRCVKYITFIESCLANTKWNRLDEVQRLGLST